MEEIIVRVKKIMKKMESFHKEMEKDGITFAQGRILFPLVENGRGYSIQELANEAGVDKSLVSRTIASLEKKGFVEREKKSDCHIRNYKIVLSEKSKKLLAKKQKEANARTQILFQCLTPEELQSLKNILDKLAAVNF